MSGHTTRRMDGLSTTSLSSISCQSRRSRPQRRPANILHLPLGQIYGPDDFVGHDPNSTADVADGLELAEHISGKDSAELSVRRGVGGFLPRRRPTRLPLVNRATVFPKVWANTAGAAPSPRGETNNTLSCEMAFDAFPEGRGLANFPLRLEPSWQSPHYIFFLSPSSWQTQCVLLLVHHCQEKEGGNRQSDQRCD